MKVLILLVNARKHSKIIGKLFLCLKECNEKILLKCDDHKWFTYGWCQEPKNEL